MLSRTTQDSEHAGRMDLPFAKQNETPCRAGTMFYGMCGSCTSSVNAGGVVSYIVCRVSLDVINQRLRDRSVKCVMPRSNCRVGHPSVDHDGLGDAFTFAGSFPESPL